MAIKARIAMTMNKGGKIILYQWRQAGWVSDVAHTKSITRRKTACLRFQKNISSPSAGMISEFADDGPVPGLAEFAPLAPRSQGPPYLRAGFHAG